MTRPHRSRTEVIDESIDFSECDTDDLVDELENRGYTCTQNGPGTFDHVEHLIVCGQVEEAKAEALEIVANLIGREFK